MKKYIAVLIIVIIASCNSKTKEGNIDQIAEDYVRLVLDVGQYDDSFVDAYFGPDEWRPSGNKAEKFPRDEFVQNANTLIGNCDALLEKDSPNSEIKRLNMLKKQLIAVKTKVEMIGGKSYKFDEEAELLYDAEPPHFSEVYFDSLLVGLDSLLPGQGDLSSRYNSFMEEFIIPKDKLDAIFKVALDVSRGITNTYIPLPKGENFKLEFVNDKVWSGYNYYQGKSHSLIQMNTDFPIHIDRAVDLASHEAYPGHHVYMTLIEQNLVNNNGWMEYSVYPLFSPISLIAEGSANYGIRMAFPGEERVAFEKSQLFPLAGIDTNRADDFYAVQHIKSQLGYADNEVARKYLDGEISRDEAVKRIEKYLLFSPEKAQQRLGFIEANRSYVINYNLGLDMIARHMKASGATLENPEKRWEIFKELLSNPYTASTLNGG